MVTTRREFVQRTALGFGAYLAVGAGASCRRGKGAAEDAGAVSGPSDRFKAAATTGVGLLSMTAVEFATAAAAAERILPRDEDPGAIDLGVPFYMDHTLANPDLADWRKPFLGGIAVLNRQCKRRYGQEFAGCTPQQQDEILAAWQKGKSGETRFFQILMNLTFEGAFGDPVHGGNKDGQGFAMVGFVPNPPLPAPELIKVGHSHLHHGSGG